MRETTNIPVDDTPVARTVAVSWRPHWRGLAIAVCAALLLSVAGAFETGFLAPAPRTVFWLIVMLSGALLGIGASAGMRSWGVLSHRVVLEGAMVSALIAVPQTLVVTGAAAIFFGPEIISIDRALLLFAAVISVTVATTTINYLVELYHARPPAIPDPVTQSVTNGDGDGDGVSKARLADRLPPHLRHAAIQALEAEDHYVRVHTEAGSDLLLMRLTDAIVELGDAQGARTHRSWWVARDAVAGARKVEGRGELMLDNGVVVPVSRSALPPLHRDGWFDRPMTAA